MKKNNIHLIGNKGEITQREDGMLQAEFEYQGQDLIVPFPHKKLSKWIEVLEIMNTAEGNIQLHNPSPKGFDDAV
jgi:hypothetical protein